MVRSTPVIAEWLQHGAGHRPEAMERDGEVKEKETQEHIVQAQRDYGLRLAGKRIPPIALGTWSWGTGFMGGNQVFGNHLRREDLEPIFRRAMEEGFNLWDTAPVYGMGAAERILGEFLSTYDREDYVLSTKFMPMGPMPWAMMGWSLGGSLNRLRVTDTDILWIHRPAKVQKWTNAIIPLVKKGLTKSVGVSNHNLRQLRQVQDILAGEGIPLAGVQNHLSLLYRDSLNTGIVDWCRREGIPFFAYMVLEQGALTGKYDAQHPFPRGTRRAKAFGREELAAIEPLLDRMREMGDLRGVGPAEIATAWVMGLGAIPLIGVTKPGHVEAAKRATQVTLSVGEQGLLEDVARETGVIRKGFWEARMR